MLPSKNIHRRAKKPRSIVAQIYGRPPEQRATRGGMGGRNTYAIDSLLHGRGTNVSLVRSCALTQGLTPIWGYAILRVPDI